MKTFQQYIEQRNINMIGRAFFDFQNALADNFNMKKDSDNRIVDIIPELTKLWNALERQGSQQRNKGFHIGGLDDATQFHMGDLYEQTDRSRLAGKILGKFVDDLQYAGVDIPSVMSELNELKAKLEQKISPYDEPYDDPYARQVAHGVLNLMHRVGLGPMANGMVATYRDQGGKHF